MDIQNNNNGIKIYTDYDVFYSDSDNDDCYDNLNYLELKSLYSKLRDDINRLEIKQEKIKETIDDLTYNSFSDDPYLTSKYEQYNNIYNLGLQLINVKKIEEKNVFDKIKNIIHNFDKPHININFQKQQLNIYKSKQLDKWINDHTKYNSLLTNNDKYIKISLISLIDTTNYPNHIKKYIYNDLKYCDYNNAKMILSHNKVWSGCTNKYTFYNDESKFENDDIFILN